MKNLKAFVLLLSKLWNYPRRDNFIVKLMGNSQNISELTEIPLNYKKSRF